MKKLTGLLAFVIFSGSNVFAQCNCSSSGSACSFLTNGMEDLNNKYKFDVGIITEYRRFEHDHTHNHHHSGDAMHNHSGDISISNLNVSQLTLLYKANKQIVLNANFPYLISQTTNGEQLTSIGDVMFNAIYKPIKNNGLSIIAGFKFPTGKNLNLPNQNISIMGTGSFDPIIGFRFNRNIKKWLINNQAFFKYTTKGFDNINYGVFNFVQGLIGYSILNTYKDSAQKFTSMSIHFGFNHEYYGKQHVGNVYNGNSGGNALFIPVLLNYTVNRFDFGFTYSHPLYQFYFGEQNKQLNRFKINLNYKL